MAKQKIRIRLKAYDHRILDQSQKKSLKQQNVLVQLFQVRFHYRLKKQSTRFFVRFISTKILVSSSNNGHISV
jgi:ribosomal protein S10